MACKVKVNRHGFLAFRLYWNGTESWEGTGLKDNAKNRKRVEARAVDGFATGPPVYRHT